jgi:hypothetical protein
LIFTETTQLRAAARFTVTSPLAVKPRRRRAWRSHGRYRVRKRSSRVAVESLPLLGATARMHAWRSHGRHRVCLRSSRVAVFFLLPVVSLRLLGAAAAIRASLAAAEIYAWRFHRRHRVRQRSGSVDVLFLLVSPPFTACATVAAVSPSPPIRLPGSTAAIHFSAVACFLRVFYLRLCARYLEINYFCIVSDQAPEAGNKKYCYELQSDVVSDLLAPHTSGPRDVPRVGL